MVVMNWHTIGQAEFFPILVNAAPYPIVMRIVADASVALANATPISRAQWLLEHWRRDVETAQLGWDAGGISGNEVRDGHIRSQYLGVMAALHDQPDETLQKQLKELGKAYENAMTQRRGSVRPLDWVPNQWVAPHSFDQLALPAEAGSLTGQAHYFLTTAPVSMPTWSEPTQPPAKSFPMVALLLVALGLGVFVIGMLAPGSTVSWITSEGREPSLRDSEVG